MTTVLIPPQKVAIENIMWQDKFTMARAEMNADSIKACAERWSEASANANPFEDAPQPITLYLDGEGLYWVGDGRHRIAGAVKAGRTKVEAIVVDGTKRDALDYALKCNVENGTAYTPRDNTLRIKKEHALHSEWSDNKMAKELKLSVTTVNRVRAKLLTKDTEVVKEVKAEAAKAAAAPAPKTADEAKKSQAALKSAVRAKSTKAKPAPKTPKEPPASSKITDSAGTHGKEVEAALANLSKVDDEIQKYISSLVKQFDIRNEITGEGNAAKSHYAAIVHNMDLIITEWKAWKLDG
jgi:ParB-like chromosome segregation protein Spo0J